MIYESIIDDIYQLSEFNDIRYKLAKHLQSTIIEQNENEEFPTPPKLIDTIISKIPGDIFKKPCKIFEPFCGKGNILLAIFDQ